MRDGYLTMGEQNRPLPKKPAGFSIQQYIEIIFWMWNSLSFLHVPLSTGQIQKGIHRQRQNVRHIISIRPLFLE